MPDTRTRILDAAERLLSQRGFASASLRTITTAAGANLGAVNYHFRSKEALIQAVFARRLQPLNRARLSALDACEAEAKGKAVPLEALLSAFIGPVLKLEGNSAAFLQLLGRMYSEPSLDVQRIFTAELGEVVQRFTHAFRRTLPQLPAEDLFWRLFFTIGAMAHTLAAGSLLKFLSAGICNPSDMEDAEMRLVRFTGAGLSAPPVKRKKKKTGGDRAC
jgi:AcrR family transcriptional regulator